ncbi:uncharacterized protein LOC123519088 isoform X2 [Portunus trituberculatus]|uniref:uncharacterized protein LOC123519088 isoform X2 n=1 Tax=Portunus trituberculatus TaxID=210409 RepID=UPI001E1CD10F|nr:uncharacterized protein LOC123519088 isoform X2 [Portunus trituberculatus]
MKEISLTIFVMALVLVEGDRPAGIEQYQSTLVPKDTGWKPEKQNMQDELLGRWKSRDEQPRLGSLERVPRSAKPLETMCDCFRGLASLSTCRSLINESVAVIIDGKCGNGAQLLRPFDEQDKDNLTLSSSSFLDDSGCKSAELLVVESSGEERDLHLKDKAYVWLCSNSLGTSLQKLVITDVDEVKMAARVLAHRVTDFTLSVEGTFEDLTFPQEALVVETEEIINADDVSNKHMESILGYRHFPQINVLVSNANFVTFKTKSVLAPYVWVKVQLTRKLVVETDGMEAVLNLALRVSLTIALEMNIKAVAVNKLQVINVPAFLLREKSVTVKTPEGQVIVRDVQSMVAHEKSLILGHGATLELSNVKFLSGFSPAFVAQSPLDSVVLSGVVADSSANSLCLATHNLTMNNAIISGCLRFMRRTGRNTKEESRLALCEVSSMEEMADPCHCIDIDPRCSFCAALACDLTPTSSNVSTQRPHPIQEVSLEEVSEHPERKWWEEPIYFGLLVVVAAVVVLVLLYCIYHLRKRSQDPTSLPSRSLSVEPSRGQSSHQTTCMTTTSFQLKHHTTTTTMTTGLRGSYF